MRKVKIISGAYGLRIKQRNVLCSKNMTANLEDSEAARLVDLGVAEYCDYGVATPPIDDDTSNTGDTGSDANDAKLGTQTPLTGAPMYFAEMKVKELRDVGKKYGISFGVGTTKEEMVKTLNKFFAGEDFSDEESGDEVPELTAELPV